LPDGSRTLRIALRGHTHRTSWQASFGTQGDLAGAEPLYRRSLAIYERALGPEHPNTAQSMSNLAQMLRDKGGHEESANLYRRILVVGEQILGRSDAPPPSLLSRMAISHNELAFHTHVPAKEWDQAASHYQRSLELFEQLREPVEVANVGLNLQTLSRLSGRPVDVSRVRDLTRILEEAGDRRAEKGHKLLRAVS
jgi:tetratricopeptide (TPR) repeat protein